MIHTLQEHGPWLRLDCDDVDPTSEETYEIVQELLLAVGGVGVGLAAPQIGYHKAIFVAQLEGVVSNFIVACNPHVLIKGSGNPQEDRIVSVESCLSIPNISHEEKYEVYACSRAKNIRATWFGLDGLPQSRDLSGFPAVIFQHETDHLNGILISDHGKKVHPALSQESN